MEDRVIDLKQLPSGATYEDQYGRWLELFRIVAESAERMMVLDPPASWVPLLRYLGAAVEGAVMHFAEDEMVPDPHGLYERMSARGRQREYVEMVCACRPELVDALWKSDAEWRTVGRDHAEQRAFIVANYNAMYRPEIMEFLRRVEAYRPPAHVRYAVITNCAADKPYPSPLHREILARLPDERWHLVIATGVLGVVPIELWGEMPLYDSGVPNFWRCMSAWERYLGRANYAGLVAYTEFYSRSLARALSTCPCPTAWAVAPGQYANYLPLLSETNLEALRRAIETIAQHGEHGPCERF